MIAKIATMPRETPMIGTDNLVVYGDTKGVKNYSKMYKVGKVGSLSLRKFPTHELDKDN